MALGDGGKRELLRTADEEQEYGAVGIVFLHGEEGNAGATTVGCVIGRWRESVQFLEFDEKIGVFVSACEKGEHFFAGEEIGEFCGVFVIVTVNCILPSLVRVPSNYVISVRIPSNYIIPTIIPSNPIIPANLIQTPSLSLHNTIKQVPAISTQTVLLLQSHQLRKSRQKRARRNQIAAS